jgi:hypothetical protein
VWMMLNERTAKGKRNVLVNMECYAKVERDGTGALLITIDEKQALTVCDSLEQIAAKMMNPHLRLRCD